MIPSMSSVYFAPPLTKLVRADVFALDASPNLSFVNTNTTPTLRIALTMASVITIPAGRSFRRSQSAKWVDPQPEKGMIELRPDQGILTFSA